MNDISLYDSSKGLNLIVKTPGIACNLNCDYCFEIIKSAPHSYVTAQTLKDTIDMISGTLSIVFHGGEPLIIGIKRFRGLLDVVREYYPTKVIAVRIQTNGTLLDQQWIDLLFKDFKDLKIEIAISLDGTEKMNILRKDKNGCSSFQSVRNAFKLLEINGVSAGMLSVVSRKSLDCYTEYIVLLSSIPNLRFVKLNALFNIEKDQLSAESITPSEYSKFIIDVSNAYIASKLYKKFPLEPLLSIMQRLNDKPSKYCNYSARKCFNYICLYPGGILSPCDCLSVDDYSIPIDVSQSLDGILTAYVRSDKCNELKKLILKCDSCNLYEFCKGGCLSQRFYFRNNTQLSDDYCSAKHMLYDYFSNMLVNRV